ncbi:MAG: hypothetical protein ACM3QU_08645 [Verrucomicrobiota bacterium]
MLRADRRGLPPSCTLVPANEHGYERLLDLVDHGETVIADKGLWGRAYNERMQCADVRLVTPAKSTCIALTIGILPNTLTRRPARALAAYDGR